MTRTCPKCANECRDSDKFCQVCGYKFENLPAKAKNNSIIHTLFYWNVEDRYVFSMTKLISIGVFLVFASSIFQAGAAGIIMALIIAGLVFIIGFSLRRIFKLDVISPNVLENTDYGFLTDLKNKLFFWQDKKTGQFTLSKTKTGSFIIFCVAVIWGLFQAPPSVLALFLLGLVFAVPAYAIGYLIHRKSSKKAPEITQTPKKPVEKPKPQVTEVKPEPAEFNRYRSQLESLREEYYIKESHARELIEKRFEPPQITYDRFISVVDSSTKLFEKQADAINSMIDLAGEESPRIDSEIESKMEVMKSLIKKITDLSNELVLNIGKSDEGDVKNLLVDMEELIDSVREY